MNPLKQSDRSKLARAIRTSRKTLRPFCENRKKLIEEYVGSHWGDSDGDGDSKVREVLVNMLNLTANTYTFSLAAERPRVLITTAQDSLYRFSKTFQTAVNNHIAEIHIEESLRMIVLDAFFSVGIAKVFLAPSKPIEMPNPDMPTEPWEGAPQGVWDQYREAQAGGIEPNIWVDPGRPMLARVSLDDFIFDTRATSWEKIEFAVHEYRVPLEDVKGDMRFDDFKENVEKLKSSSKWDSDQRHEGADPVSEMTQANVDHDETSPMVNLMDVWLPREGKWCVFSDAGEDGLLPLLIEKWDGPEGGPFHLLSFSDVPDNIMPSSPAQNLKGLHDLMNSIMRKQSRNSRDSKTVTAYRGDGQDAQQIQSAGNNEMIKVSDIDSVKEIHFAGVDQTDLAFFSNIDGTFSRMAGNLDAMAGLGPQSDTLGQDKLIHGAVSKREAKMQYHVVAFTANIMSDIGWMLWVDAVKEIPGQRHESGIDLPIDASWTPGEREGDYLQYNFKVEPYSMAYKSPTERMQSLTAFLRDLALPLREEIRAQGGSIDFKAIVEDYADMADMPRIKRWITFDDGYEPTTPEGNAPGMPANTSREYVRKSVSTGGTPDAQRVQNQQSLLASAGQQQGQEQQQGGMQ